MGGDGSLGGGDHHLAKRAGTDISGSEDARDGALHALVRDDIARFIGGGGRDKAGLGDGSGEDEYRIDRLFVLLIGVFQQYRGDLFVPPDLLGAGVEADLYTGVLQDPLSHTFLSAETVTAMDQNDLIG